MPHFRIKYLSCGLHVTSLIIEKTMKLKKQPNKTPPKTKKWSISKIDHMERQKLMSEPKKTAPMKIKKKVRCLKGMNWICLL